MKDLSKKILDLADVILVALDREGKIQTINRKGCAVLGYARKDLLGRNWFRVALPKRCRDQVLKIHGKVIRGKLKAVRRFTNSIVTKKGEERLISWHNTFLRNPGGRITGSLSSGEDITERTNSQKRLRHFNAVLQASRRIEKRILYERGPERLIKYACIDLVRAGGYNYAWIILVDRRRRPTAHTSSGLGDDLQRMVERAVRGRTCRCYRNALRGRKVQIIRHSNRSCPACPMAKRCRGRGIMTAALRNDGTTHGVLSVCLPEGLSPGREETGLFHEVAQDLAFALSRFRDEEIRKRVERELKESEAISSALLDTPIDSAGIHDADGIIIKLNETIARKLGGKPGVMIGRCMWDLLPPDIATRRRKITRRIIRTGRPVRFTDEQNGLWLDHVGFPIRGSAGKVTRIGFIARDITEMKRLQKELRRTERLAAMGNLAASVAHEVNSPLQAISVLLDDLQDGCIEDKEYRRNIGIVKNAFKTIRNTVRRLLDLNRPGHDDMLPCRINDVIRRTGILMRSHLQRNRVRLYTSLSPKMPSLIGSPHQLGQVFVNLFNNAVEAVRHSRRGKSPRTSSASDIRVQSAVRDGRIIVSVSDNGPGVPVSDLEKIFDPFYTTKAPGEGTGLGLNISHGIVVEKHGGQISVESKPGATRFKVKLPITEPA